MKISSAFCGACFLRRLLFDVSNDPDQWLSAPGHDDFDVVFVNFVNQREAVRRERLGLHCYDPLRAFGFRDHLQAISTVSAEM
jgi:hypothetical protein